MNTNSLQALANQFGYKSEFKTTYGWMGVMTKIETGQQWATSNVGRFSSVEEAEAFRTNPANASIFDTISNSGEYAFSYHLTSTTTVSASQTVTVV